MSHFAKILSPQYTCSQCCHAFGPHKGRGRRSFLPLTNEAMRVRGVTCPREVVVPGLRSHSLGACCCRPGPGLWCLGPCPSAHGPDIWGLLGRQVGTMLPNPPSPRAAGRHTRSGGCESCELERDELGQEDGGRELRSQPERPALVVIRAGEESSGLSQWKVFMRKSLRKCSSSSQDSVVKI